MQKHVVIIGVALLVIVGGIFLLLNQTETKSRLGEPEYSTTPTQWSQAGDYKKGNGGVLLCRRPLLIKLCH